LPPPTKKKAVPLNKEKKKARPVLTKMETPSGPGLTKEKTTPLDKEEITLKEKKAPANKEEVTLKKKTAPTDTKDITPPRKAQRKVQTETLDPDLSKSKKLYETAMSDFTAGRFKDALGKFKKIVKTEKNETVMRRIADSYYLLGEKGDERYFLEAIEQYRNVIRNYPESKKENEQAIYRLAQSYSRSNLDFKALIEFKKFCLRYSESGDFPESLYMIGKLHHKTGDFNDAIKGFKAYIKKFPEGRHVREVYFNIGDCYSRMNQFNDADVWYGKALKRWPTLEDLPEDTLSTLGAHYFQGKNYNEAQRVLFIYLNLFSKGKNGKTALYTIARSFEKMGHLPLALKTLSLLVDRYPGSKEARKSALIMANAGVKDPGIKLPTQIFSGMENYRDPIKAYDKIKGKFLDLDKEEELIFQKGYALIKKKRYQEAFDNSRIQLNRFPKGKYGKAGKENLILSAGGLIDDYYSKKDYLAVSDLYFNFDRNALLGNGSFDRLFKIGNSLKQIDLSDPAAEIFEEMINRFPKDKRVNPLLLTLAELDYGKKDYKGAKKRLNQLLEKRPGVDKKTGMTARTLLGDICFKEGLFKEAVGFYSAVLSPEAGGQESAAIRKKYADSLKGMGLYSSAFINYKRVLKNCDNPEQKCSAPVMMGSYEELGDYLYNEGKFQQSITMYEQSLKNASEDQQNMWAKFNMGRGYANMGNKPMADKSFNELKNENSNEFWSRVMEYYTVDKNRIEI